MTVPPNNEPYFQEQITLSILSLQESGELEKIRQKWFEAESLCTEDETSDENTASGLFRVVTIEQKARSIKLVL